MPIHVPVRRAYYLASPDLVGSATFHHYQATSKGAHALLTSATGTIRVTVRPGGDYVVEAFGEARDAPLPAAPLTAVPASPLDGGCRRGRS
jgi:hypothetical protein